jgi:HSP20 family protein
LGGIVPWDPWREMEAWTRRAGRAIASPFDWIWGEAAGWPQAAHPPVEVFERDGDVVVRADVPGMAPANLDVRVDADTVTIRGEVRAEERREDRGFFRSERRYGAFRRVVPLPARVEPSRARATYRHGVLEVVAPRVPDDQDGGRRIEVRGEGD